MHNESRARLIWNLEGESVEALDARLLPLLQAVAASASLTAAVADCRISYRAAWGLLREYQRKLGEPLVLLERGRGASLTPSGERLIGVERAATRRLARILPGLAAEISSAPRKEERAATQQLRVAASHDLVLAALANALPDRVRTQARTLVHGQPARLEGVCRGPGGCRRLPRPHRRPPRLGPLA